MPNDAAIKQLLDDCAGYALRNYHAPPVRTGSAFDTIRIDRNFGVKKPKEYVVDKARHDKVSLIKPAFSGAGQAAGIALAIASPSAGPFAPAVAAVGIGITAGATVLDYVSDEVKFKYKERKKNKTLEDKAFLLTEAGLGELAHNFDKAVRALCDYWDEAARPGPTSCVEAARLGFAYAKLEKRFMLLNSDLSAVYLRKIAKVIQEECLRAFMFVRTTSRELVELVAPHDRAVLESVGAIDYTPKADGYLNWPRVLAARTTSTAGVRSAIYYGRRLGDRKEICSLVNGLRDKGQLPSLKKSMRAAGLADGLVGDITGIDPDNPLGTVVGQVQEQVMSLVENLIGAAIQSADLASAAVDTINPAGAVMNPQFAASVTGSVVEAFAIMADDRANWNRISRKLNPLTAIGPATRPDLLDYRDRVWSARKLLETRLEPILGGRDWLEKGKASITHAITRVRAIADTTSASAAAAAAAAAGFAGSGASTPPRRPAVRAPAAGATLAASSSSPTVEAISSMYYLQAKAFEMLRDSALIQFLSQLVTDGLAFMQRCRAQTTAWTAPGSPATRAATTLTYTGDLDRKLTALFSGAACPDGHTCYHAVDSSARYQPRFPLSR